MKLSEDRIGHIVRGSLYLAAPKEKLAPYKEECRKVYGDLRGVKFVRVKVGTHLTIPSSWSGFTPPYQSEMEVLK